MACARVLEEEEKEEEKGSGVRDAEERRMEEGLLTAAAAARPNEEVRLIPLQLAPAPERARQAAVAMEEWTAEEWKKSERRREKKLSGCRPLSFFARWISEPKGKRASFFFFSTLDPRPSTLVQKSFVFFFCPPFARSNLFLLFREKRDSRSLCVRRTTVSASLMFSTARRSSSAPRRGATSSACIVRRSPTTTTSSTMMMLSATRSIHGPSVSWSRGSSSSSRFPSQASPGGEQHGSAPGPVSCKASESASIDSEAASDSVKNFAPLSSSTSTSSTSTSATAAALASPSTKSSEERPSFSWNSQWWPVAVEADLPRDRPVPVKLLGRRLVLWWAGEGEGEGGKAPLSSSSSSSSSSGEKRRGGGGYWSCLDDACSHRLAPLSEGRIDRSCVSCNSSEGGSASNEKNGNGTCRALSCSYHGFAFDGEGAAVTVPQARHDGGAEAERRAARSPRAHVRSYPTLALDQLVWVWGSGGEQAAREAAEAPLPPGPPAEIRRLMLEAAASAAAGPPSPLVALITNQQYWR